MSVERGETLVANSIVALAARDLNKAKGTSMFRWRVESGAA
jgi:hypothetical protein